MCMVMAAMRVIGFSRDLPQSEITWISPWMVSSQFFKSAGRPKTKDASSLTPLTRSRMLPPWRSYRALFRSLVIAPSSSVRHLRISS